MCDELTEAPLEPGVGISVNSDFKNVNWVAVDTKSFFLQGDLPEGQRLDHAAYQRAQARATELDILRGVQFHNKVLQKKPETMSESEYMLQETMGTDFAISFGRNIYCVRVPLSRDALVPAMDYLNGLNDKYFHGPKEYTWSGIFDNCTHVTHNALAAAGIWEEKLSDRFLLIQIFNLAIPSNDFVNLAKRSTQLPLEDVKRLYLDPAARAGILNGKGLPTRHGSLAEIIPMVQDNDLYAGDTAFFMLDLPGLKPQHRSFSRFQKDQHLLDLQTNLIWFQKRYQKAIANRRSIEMERQAILDWPEEAQPISLASFAEFHERYYRYLAEQLRDLQIKLTSLTR